MVTSAPGLHTKHSGTPGSPPLKAPGNPGPEQLQDAPAHGPEQLQGPFAQDALLTGELINQTSGAGARIVQPEWRSFATPRPE